MWGIGKAVRSVFGGDSGLIAEVKKNEKFNNLSLILSKGLQKRNFDEYEFRDWLNTPDSSNMTALDHALFLHEQNETSGNRNLMGSLNPQNNNIIELVSHGAKIKDFESLDESLKSAIATKTLNVQRHIRDCQGGQKVGCVSLG